MEEKMAREIRPTALRRWFRKQLNDAQVAGRSVSGTAQEIYDKLLDMGFNRGFLPLELPVIEDGFAAGSITIGYCDYKTTIIEV